MTEFYQIVSMSRPFRTLSSRVIPDPTLRNLSVSCMGLLKFSLFEAVKKSVRYSIRAIINYYENAYNLLVFKSNFSSRDEETVR